MPSVLVKKIGSKVLEQVYKSLQKQKRLVKGSGKAWSSKQAGILITETRPVGIEKGQRTYLRIEKGKTQMTARKSPVVDKDAAPVSMEDLKKFMRLVGVKK